MGATVAKPITRRQILAGLAGAGALGVAGLLAERSARSGPPGDKPAFLLMVGAFGGASIIDSFLPIKKSESQNGATVNCYEDIQVVTPPGSNIRAADTSGNLLGTSYDA